MGFIKNKYIGRTFISPTQAMRENEVNIKLNPIRSVVEGKRVVLIDDSIVRGTSCRRTIDLLRKAGAKDMRVSAPPFVAACYYGTDIDDPSKLIANNHSVEEIAKIIGVDSLGYLSLQDVVKLADNTQCGFCTACFGGGYITAGYAGVKLMAPHVARTRIPGVVSGIGGFGGLFAPDLTGIREPVLVSGTDGVGTKIRIAQLLDRHDTVGVDCVAMCVNDIICCGAKPLFFLDYIAIGKNVPEKVAAIVSGVAEGCVQAGCALIGGETAEHPGIMAPEDYDLAGFSVGIVDKGDIIDPDRVRSGDVVLALPSSGLHSNGFSLVRKVFHVEHANLTVYCEDLGESLGEALLTPTRIYVKPVLAAIDAAEVHGISHITGGGFYENIPRCLPDGMTVKIEKAAVRTPPIFKMLRETGHIPERDMFNTFNMGVGMAVIVSRDTADQALSALAQHGCPGYVIGEVISGEERVILC